MPPLRRNRISENRPLVLVTPSPVFREPLPAAGAFRYGERWGKNGVQAKGYPVQRSSSAPRNLYLGLTGGIASGKSSVAEMLRERGAEIIDFDLLAREVVQPGSAALDEIAAFFGWQVLRPDGSLDRKKLRAIVFSDQRKDRAAGWWRR
jgi:hypothetical protein